MKLTDIFNLAESEKEALARVYSSHRIMDLADGTMKLIAAIEVYHTTLKLYADLSPSKQEAAYAAIKKVEILGLEIEE